MATRCVVAPQASALSLGRRSGLPRPLGQPRFVLALAPLQRSPARRGRGLQPGIVALMIKEEEAVINTPTGPMRTSIFMPQCVSAGAKFPGIAVYSEIYQVTGPVERLCRKLAGEGFVVAAGDVYHEYVKGPLDYVDGTDQGNELKITKPLASYDSDAVALVKWLQDHPHTSESKRVGAFGLCLGGGMALRAAAVVPDIRAAVCLFPTDLHNEGLGAPKAKDPKRAEETLSIIARGGMSGEALLVMGNRDTHIDKPGRDKIRAALYEGGATFQWAELGAAHAFTRDDQSKGRYDPAVSEIAWQMAFEVLRRRLIYGLDNDGGAAIKPM